MAKLRFIIIALILLLAGGAIYWEQYYSHFVAQGEVRVSGNIETTETQIAFKIPGRVVRRLVDEGQSVAENQLIAELDTSDLQATVDLRRAEVEAARAALAELKAGSRIEEKAEAKAAMDRAAHALADLEAGSRPQEIESAKAAVTAAAAEAKRLDGDRARAEKLFQRQMLSKEDYDAVRTAYEVAVQKHRQTVENLNLVEEGPRKEQIEQARAALAQAKAKYDLVMAGPRQEDIDQAQARLQQAEAALKLAEVQLSYAKVYSPMAGIVLSKNIEPGEYVAPGTPVVTIGDMRNVWLRAYISEEDLGRVKVEQKAGVTTDTYPDKTYPGYVAFIAQEAEFTPKNVETQKERVKLVYRIKINIDNPDMELKPGMPADAVIEVGQ